MTTSHAEAPVATADPSTRKAWTLHPGSTVITPSGKSIKVVGEYTVLAPDKMRDLVAYGTRLQDMEYASESYRATMLERITTCHEENAFHEKRVAERESWVKERESRIEFYKGQRDDALSALHGVMKGNRRLQRQFPNLWKLALGYATGNAFGRKFGEKAATKLFGN